MWNYSCLNNLYYFIISSLVQNWFNYLNNTQSFAFVLECDKIVLTNNDRKQFWNACFSTYNFFYRFLFAFKDKHLEIYKLIKLKLKSTSFLMMTIYFLLLPSFDFNLWQKCISIKPLQFNSRFLFTLLWTVA